MWSSAAIRCVSGGLTLKRIVLGMTAHVDSGKTTLAEAMLYRAGEIRRLGRVDHGNAFLDTDPLEKSRGITIFSKQAVLRTQNAEFTLLDTPGHVDFAAEAERALTAVDMAVLVISGTDGVQSHTETLWRILRRYNIPAFIFVNKMDIAQERGGILDELRKRLSGGCMDFSTESSLAEAAAELDEDCMESFLETGEVSDELISRAISGRRIFPVLFGAALKLKGIDELLAALDRYAAEPERSAEFAARVYKIARDENGARLTHIKINGGSAAV
ncbi:MAG: GTP-binding protein, partial [Oscillospiraceae bacterium]|nr:GTP-binding protein [Oscillospiraceae bacterium]